MSCRPDSRGRNNIISETTSRSYYINNTEGSLQGRCLAGRTAARAAPGASRASVGRWPARPGLGIARSTRSESPSHRAFLIACVGPRFHGFSGVRKICIAAAGPPDRPPRSRGSDPKDPELCVSPPRRSRGRGPLPSRNSANSATPIPPQGWRRACGPGVAMWASVAGSYVMC